MRWVAEDRLTLVRRCWLAGDRRRSSCGHRSAQRSQIKWKRRSRTKEYGEKKMEAQGLVTGQNLGKHLCLGSGKGLSQEIRGMMKSKENQDTERPRSQQLRWNHSPLVLPSLSGSIFLTTNPLKRL